MSRALGFLATVAVSFGVGYFGIAWFKLGTPLPIPSVTVRPMQPTASAPTFAEVSARGEPAPRQAVPEDNDPGRDALRHATLQAANAYQQSSCDRTMRENLIKALQAYAKAFADKMGCTASGCGGRARVELGAQMFSTPLDLKVREAVSEAFAQGGVTVEDFPRDLHLTVAIVAQGRGSPSECQRANAAGRN